MNVEVSGVKYVVVGTSEMPEEYYINESLAKLWKQYGRFGNIWNFMKFVDFPFKLN